MEITAVRPQWVTLPDVGPEPGMRIYMVRPADEGTYPSVLVIQEAFGLDEHIQDVTLRFAREGYVAIAPDLFSLDQFGRTVKPQEIQDLFALRRQIPVERRRDPAALDDEIAKLPPTQAERMRLVARWSSNRDLGQFVEPLSHVLNWARRQPGSTGKVGITGYCMGGGVTLQVAFAGLPVDAAAPYYGSNPPLEKANQVRCPLLLIYGRKDPFIMPGVPALLGALLDAELDFGMHIYEDAGHAFLNDMRPDMFNPEAAADAWYLTLEFFQQHLET
ncbi:MAG TPA: dienelactone hydrolase family protein [Chloroflexota bacterium]|nr:dienelactone hydrolase family protein [Chloroflexota bacterium]